MCADHSTVLVEIPTATPRGEHGRARGIDRCIVPLVQALNTAGLATVASCCGHGYRPGNVILGDGREVFIAPDHVTARTIDRAFPLTSYGEAVRRG